MLTKLFLELDPTYATKLRHVWLLRDVPMKVRAHLALPDTDQGIDLIAETHDGEFWAVQCKYRDSADASLSWREVSTFTGLTFGICKNISYSLIAFSGDRYADLLKDGERIGFIASDTWHALGEEFFARVHAKLAHQPAELSPLAPRPHQARAIEQARSYFSEPANTRGKLIMPCGTGKSLTAFWIARELEARTILVAVPSLALMRQTLRVWLREFAASGQGGEVDWLCVCSDESVGARERDDAAVYAQDLGVPCVTDQGEIAAWLGRTARDAARGLQHLPERPGARGRGRVRPGRCSTSASWMRRIRRLGRKAHSLAICFLMRMCTLIGASL